MSPPNRGLVAIHITVDAETARRIDAWRSDFEKAQGVYLSRVAASGALLVRGLRDEHSVPGGKKPSRKMRKA